MIACSCHSGYSTGSTYSPVQPVPEDLSVSSLDWAFSLEPSVPVYASLYLYLDMFQDRCVLWHGSLMNIDRVGSVAVAAAHVLVSV